MIFFLKNDFKKAFKRKYIIGFILIALIFQGFLQFGKFNYLNNKENRISLQKAERAKVSHYVYFRQYATYGIKMMFIPSQFSILFNDSTFELLISNGNIADTFDIDSPKKGKEIFSENSPFLNFIGVALLFIFYFGIVYGKDTTINKDYLKFLSNRFGSKKCLWFILFFRLILFTTAFLLMFVINITVLLLNNINLFQAPLITFFWGMILLTAVSFAIGCLLGTVKSNFRRNTAFFVIYVVSAILLVLLLNFFTKINAGDIKPVFEFDIENLEAVMFEERMYFNKNGSLPLNRNPTREETIDARQAVLNQAEKISANLDLLKSQLISKIKARKFVASLFPTLFYFSICEDASTNSHDRFIDFYTFSQKRKQEFGKFCVDKMYQYPLPKNRPKIENFIKDNEDLFFAQSKLPRNFLLGSIISILWIAGFLFAAYRRTLKQIKAEPGKVKGCEVDMKSNEFNYFLTADQGVKNQVYNHFSGDGISNIIMTLDGEVLEKTDFFYVYETGRFLNDVDQGCLYKELMGEKMPGGVKPWEPIVEYAAHTKKILLLDDFFKGMDLDDIDDFIADVKKRGIISLYVGGEFFQASYLGMELLLCPMDISIPGVQEKIRARRKREEKNQ